MPISKPISERAARVLAVLSLFVLVFVATRAASQTVASVSAADVQTARSAPIRASQWVGAVTTSVGTSTSALVDGDIFEGDNDDTLLFQECRVTNRHATQTLCYTVIDRATSGASGCATDCAALSAGALTCSGGAADGDPILASSTAIVPITAAECICGEASGASTTTTAACVRRRPY
jgi:hypothetical protein